MMKTDGYRVDTTESAGLSAGVTGDGTGTDAHTCMKIKDNGSTFILEAFVWESRLTLLLWGFNFIDIYCPFTKKKTKKKQMAK